MQVTSLHSYRARIRQGEYDPSEPDANIVINGLKAASPADAMRLAGAVFVGHVESVYRQDRGAQ